ncbi:MAG TPA: methylaspartate mutase accessory protein GlmL [Casimicrobiaceae bacterium]|nr:methylaspartate mutase accessory protein GlmL [Casimicrobiaceae bacterium]
MRAALLIDFGSTYTKLRAIDLERARLLGTGQGPSTVTSDVMIGVRASLADLERRLGELPRFEHRLASSSAAGGLRMVTVGLVRELTAEAARRAALGAGAKLVGTFAYRLTPEDVQRIVALAPDILLLAGGTDGGNQDVILHNAKVLGQSELACPIVLAGNRNAVDGARTALADKELIVTDNVMPEFDILNIEPARAAIRQVFIDRIVHAKGIDRARDEFDAVLMPTPAAVLEGARLLADGYGSLAGLGSVLVVDPGGATTDVHSIADHTAATGVVMQGLPEPREKRTVEGDLGMRHNAANIVEAAGSESIARDAGLDARGVKELVQRLHADVERLPQGREEIALDRALARAAVRVAVQRHCGTLTTVYTPTGPVSVQHGKDLSHVAAVIGTGGALVHSSAPRAVLAMALADDANPTSLRPRAPRLLLDRDYLLYACGLLAAVAPEAALKLALANLQPMEDLVERPALA